MMKTILIFSLTIILAACATRREPVVRVTPASVPGTMLPSDGIESVRYEENIRAYSLGRYVDPNDPLIMHEGHSIYRVETTAKWNLHQASPVSISSGPVVRIQDTAKTSALLRDELAAELNRQKEATKTIIQSGQTVTQKLGELSTAVQQTRQIAGQNTQQLQQEIDTTKSRLDLLEEDLRKKQRAEQPVSPVETPNDGPFNW